MVKNINIFTLGFLVNSCLWRLERGNLTDIAFPAALSVLCLLLVGIQSLKENVSTTMTEKKNDIKIN